MVKLRRSSLKVIERNKALLAHIKTIKLNHPFWGYRRVWAYLNYHLHVQVNKKRVYRVMQANHLLVKERRLLRAKRENLPSKAKAFRPNQIWGTDMTKVKLPYIGWTYIVIVLDWHTKKIVGYSLSTRSKTGDWLDALYAACDLQFYRGIREYPMVSLVSDNGCQPTSERYMKECAHLGIKQIFTSFNNPKGNADTERMMRTLKEELIWSNEYNTFDELSVALEGWIDEYNHEYCHSSIGYLPPAVFEKKWIKDNDITPLIAA